MIIKTILISILLLNFIHCFAGEANLYNFDWIEKNEKVYIIQNKEFIKTKRVGLDLGFMQSDSSPFQSTRGVSAAIVYYFSEEYSIDLTYVQYLNSDNEDLDNLIDANNTKPLIRKINSAKLFHFNWIPFYGKINVFDKIFFLDAGLGFGFGKFSTQGNYKTFLIPNKKVEYVSEDDTGGSFKLFGKFHVSRRFNVTFDYGLKVVQTIKSPDQQKSLLYYNDLGLSFGVLF